MSSTTHSPAPTGRPDPIDRDAVTYVAVARRLCALRA